MRLLTFFLAGCLAWAQGVSPSRSTLAPEYPRRVILDTDPGIDDAMAVLLALQSPELSIAAITVVAGNVPVELGAANALKLVELAGRTDVIVAAGAAGPLQRKLHTAEVIHGENGMGGVELPAPGRRLDHRHAVQVIRDLVEANPGQVTLVPVGPLTNIALAFLEYPELAAKTREIILMGGSAGAGNATPAAEANIFHDAESAKVVFESGVPILMVDLTACAQARLTQKHLAGLRQSTTPVAKFVAAIAEPYLAFAEKFGNNGAAIHDALAVGMAIDPSLASTLTPVHVEVETKGEFTYGATVVNRQLTVERSEWRGDRFVLVDFPRIQPNAAYPAVVDGERFVRLFLERITQEPAARK